MDQQLIAIVVLFGLRVLLLAIPNFDYLWLWTMRRFFPCCSGGNGSDQNSEEGDEGEQVRVIELLPISMDGDILRYTTGADMDECMVVIKYSVAAAIRIYLLSSILVISVLIISN